MKNIFKSELLSSDPLVDVRVSTTDIRMCLTTELSKKVIDTILLMPNGVQNVNKAVNIPETSTNLGVVITDESKITLRSALRSSKASKLEFMATTMVSLADRVGAVCNVNKPYPGWEYKEESELRDVFVQTFREQTGKEAIIEGIHAGLECGIFASKIDGLDIIAVGPSIFDPHTPKERVDYKSMDRTYTLIKNVLEKLS